MGHHFYKEVDTFGVVFRPLRVVWQDGILRNNNATMRRSLVSGSWSQGVHEVVWNGRDNDGRFVGSGIYFYRTVSDDYVGMRRMVLLK